MRYSDTAEREMPNTDNLWVLGMIIFFASKTLGVMIIEIFNKINPWIICEWPALVSFLGFSSLAIWIRRKYFNLMF